MALVQHRQISDRLTKEIVPLLCLDDVKSKNRDLTALSRALAAFSLSCLADADLATAADSVVDGFNDNGIDAIYFDPNEKGLYLVQSKWNSNHTASVDNGSVLKFLQGVKDLLSSRFDRFNPRIQSRQQEIDKAISTASKVFVVVVYSGAGTFSAENRASIESFIEDVDETKELVSSIVLNQGSLHSYVLSAAQGSTVSDSIQIFSWGYVDGPVRAYYGQIAASDLVALHRRHGHRLFSRNIRVFLGVESAVNRSITETMEERPELFWYFNNGITALANKVNRKAVGGASRESGQFDCEGLSIVNGAQTVGSLSAGYDSSSDQLSCARVPIRVVSLEGAPDGFAVSITRYNNTQNKIDSRNFVALDPEQERLRSEFLVDSIDYEYRQGEIEHSSNTRLGFVEAAIALACTDEDVNLSTLAKREVSRLWDDIEKPPYKKMFHSGQTSEAVWKKVKAFRRIDNSLNDYAIRLSGKPGNVAVHGNRFLVHVIYQIIISQGKQADISDLRDDRLGRLVRETFQVLMEVIGENYEDNYVASLFKNQTKCRDIKLAVIRKKKPSSKKVKT